MDNSLSCVGVQHQASLHVNVMSLYCFHVNINASPVTTEKYVFNFRVSQIHVPSFVFSCLVQKVVADYKLILIKMMLCTLNTPWSGPCTTGMLSSVILKGQQESTMVNYLVNNLYTACIVQLLCSIFDVSNVCQNILMGNWKIHWSVDHLPLAGFAWL